MRSTLPYDPRSDQARSAGWVERVGRRTIAAFSELGALFCTLRDALSADFAPGSAARRLVHGIMMTQVLFTGVQALSLVSVIALLIGASIIIQTNMMVPADGELIGRVLVAVVLRELAPLITAIVVAGRSGTAIATELGNMKVNSEVLALSSLGVDPIRYVVLPRMVGCIVSVFALMIYFSIVSLSAAFAIGILSSGASLSSFQQGVAGSVMPHDLLLFFVKGLGLGTIVGWLSCHFGLEVKSSPTEVPQQASRAVVMSLLGCVVYNTALTAGFYLAGRAPIAGAMKDGLWLEDAEFRYGDLWVLRQTELHVPKGRTLIVTGDNGVGKSTLLYLCAGLLIATAGRVWLDGHLAIAKRPSELMRQGVRRGFVFGQGGLLSNLSALGNVTLALRYHADVFGIDEKDVMVRARDALSQLRVAQTDFHTLPAHLSLGVRKRVALARALAVDPNFVFLDDPDGGLDSSTRQLVYERLERFRDDARMTVVIATNSRQLIDRLGIHPLELAHGHLLPEDEARRSHRA